MKHKYWLLYTTNLLLLFIASCSEELEGEKGKTTDDGYIPITLTMLLPDTPGIDTRAINDKYIDELRVFIFDNAGNYIHDAAGDNIAQSVNGLTCRILMYEGTYTFVVVANAADHIAASFPAGVPDNITYTQFKQQLTAECTDIWSTTPSTHYIPMWGMVENQTIKPTSYKVAPITLLRALAGINIKMDSGASYTLRSVTVYNNYRRGYLIPGESNWNGVVVTVPTLPTGGSLLNTAGKTVTNITNSGSECVNEIFIFETPAGADISTGGPDQNFCLVLAIDYNSNTSYYRVDFTGSEGYIPVLRNHNYTLTVKAIEREGFNSIDDALAGRPTNIIYDITDTNKSGMNNIAWDGQHYLLVSADTLNFWNSVSGQNLRIQTNYAPGWAIDTGTLPSWITILPNSSTNTAEETINIQVTADPALGDERETSFTVKAGELSLDVIVIQSHLTELRIDTDINYLIFYATVQDPVIVNVDRAPVSKPYKVEFIGDASMTWITFPTSGISATQVAFKPDNNVSSDILTGIIRFSIESDDGRVEYKDIPVRQYPGENPFEITTNDPYLSTGQNATFWILSSSSWYLKRSIPVNAAGLSGVHPPVSVPAAEFPFDLTPNHTYSERQITLVFSTSDNLTEYETIITQNGNVPQLTFSSTQNREIDIHINDNGAVVQDIPFEYNFAWRMEPGPGFGDIVSSLSRQTGVIYPCANIASGQAESLRITPYSYDGLTNIPEAGTILTSHIDFFSHNVSPYPEGNMGKINLKRTIQPVIDIINVLPLPGSKLPREGGTITVTAGSNAGWSISTSDGQTSSAPTGSYSITQLTITIPRNTDFGNEKQFDLFYTFNGETILLGQFRQEAYHLTTSYVNPGGYINGYEIACPVTISGHYPDLQIKFMDDSGTDASDIYTLTGNTSMQEVDMTLYANLKGVSRNVAVYYSFDNGITWQISTPWKLQYRNGFYTNGQYYRGYIALENARVEGNAGSTVMTWAEAMGINTHYNDWTYYNTYNNSEHENYSYTTTESTGCGAYGETDFGSGWRLPSSTEMKLVLKAQIEETYDFGIQPGQKFHTSYDRGVTSSRIVWIEGGIIKESESQGNKNELINVRCVYRFGN